MFKNSVSPYSDRLVIVDSIDTFDGRGMLLNPWRLFSGSGKAGYDKKFVISPYVVST